MMYGLGADRIAGCLGYGGAGGAGFFPWIHLGTGLLVLGLLTALAVLLVRKLTAAGAGSGSAAETLALRFANGEIDEEEYQRKKKLLK